MSNSLDKEAVLTANQEFYNAFCERNLPKMSLLWWQGQTSLCIHPGGRILTGWESIKSSWDGIFRNTDSVEIEIEIIKVEVDSAIAYVMVREVVLQFARGGKLKAQSLATNIFQKMAQKWYIIHHHGSPIVR